MDTQDVKVFLQKLVTSNSLVRSKYKCWRLHLDWQSTSPSLIGKNSQQVRRIKLFIICYRTKTHSITPLFMRDVGPDKVGSLTKRWSS